MNGRSRSASEAVDRPLTILVVGGTPGIGETLTTLRTTNGDTSVIRVETAAEAVQRLETDANVGIVVSAAQLTETTGLDLLEQVREMNPTLPFVVFGSDLPVTVERDALAAGATDVVRFSTDTAGSAVLRARVERAIAPSNTTDPVSDRQFQAFLDGLAEAVLVIDTDGIIRYANSGVTDVFGYSPTAIVDGPLETIISDGELHQRLSGFKRTQENSRTHAEARGHHRDGRTLDLDVSIGTLAHAGPEYLVGIVRDVTAQRRRERELEIQSAGFERLAQITDMVLRIERAITAAETRDELERGVCTELAGTDGFLFSWIGAVGTRPSQVEPRAIAGHNSGYLDEVDRTLQDSAEPSVEAARSRTRATVNRISSGHRQEPWRRAARDRGFESALSVPVVLDERLFGVLSVYAERPDTFDEFTAHVFDNIAGRVAHGIQAFAHKRALMADSVTDLELDCPPEVGLFGRVAHATGATLELNGFVPKGDSLLVFLAVSGATPQAVEAALADERAVTSVTWSSRDDADAFEVSLRGESLVTRIAEQGATLGTLVADSGGTRILATLPFDADVRRFVKTLERTCPGITLQSRSHRDRVADNSQRFRTVFERHVTDRQLQALQTAFLSGYFEWPREHTAEEVAELLGITQPTLNRHLRVAERQLLALLFDAADGPDNEM